MIVLCAVVPIGCVERRAVGGTTVYATETWVIVTVGLAAAAVSVLGWYVRRKQKWLGYLILGAGLLVLGTTVPGLSLSRTIIDADHVEWRRGLNRYVFRFDELAAIKHTVKRIPIGRSIKNVHYLDFSRKSGEVVPVQVEPTTDRFLQDAIPEILERASERGVKCADEAAI